MKQELANELRNRLLRGERKSMLSVEYSETHLIWSLDIFEQVHRTVRFHVLQVIDLGSRMKLEPAIKVGAFTGEEVAEHLNYLMHKHEAPRFLKRDNGSNLNSSEVFSILKMFAVIPFNSPMPEGKLPLKNRPLEPDSKSALRMRDECFLFTLEKQQKKRKKIEKEIRRKPNQVFFYK